MTDSFAENANENKKQGGEYILHVRLFRSMKASIWERMFSNRSDELVTKPSTTYWTQQGDPQTGGGNFTVWISRQLLFNCNPEKEKNNSHHYPLQWL